MNFSNTTYSTCVSVNRAIADVWLRDIGYTVVEPWRAIGYHGGPHLHAHLEQT